MPYDSKSGSEDTAGMFMKPEEVRAPFGTPTKIRIPDAVAKAVFPNEVVTEIRHFFESGG